MDSLVILAVALFAGILLYGVSGKGPKTPTPSAPSEQKSPRYSAPKPVPSTKPTTPAPFDARTAEPPKQTRTVSGLVYVTDGDTITIKKTQIRLFGIDAPELNHPYGKAAKWALHRLCKGQRVRAEILEVDDYGRTVAQCFLPDGRDLSAEMVKQGLAIDWPKFSGGRYRSLETDDARKKLFLADARQKGRMHVWKRFEARQAGQ